MHPFQSIFRQLEAHPAPRTRRLVAALLVAPLLILAGGPSRADEPTGPAVVVQVGAEAAASDAVFSADPATADGRDGRQRFSYQLDPGQRVDDFVEVTNEGTTALTLALYVTDAYNTPDGAFAVLTADQAPQDVGTWSDLGQRCDPQADPACLIPSRAEVALEPGASAIVPFSVTVPADARPGDHGAGLVVSVASGEGQVVVENRVITRMYVRVAGELQPHVAVGGVVADLESGLLPVGRDLDVAYTLTNTGNVALGGRLTVEATGPFGNVVASAERADLPELLPGQARTSSVRLTGVSQQGLLTVRVRLEPSVAPGALDPGVLSSSTREATVVAVPWLVVLVLLAAGGGLWWRLRRRRSRAAAQQALIEEARAAGREQALADVPVPAP